MSWFECHSELVALHMPMTQQDQDAIRTHLAKILASGGFVKADRLSRFLRFTVEAKLNGEEDKIKEYVLGREVFDRNGDYDPRTDPIVRVEARRLRTKLEEYYSVRGHRDAVRIEFLKGSYVPVISAGEAPTAHFPKKRVAVWVAGGLLLLAVALAGYWLWPSSTSEIVAVVPSAWLWGETANAVGLEEGLAERISIELANQRVARVVGWPVLVRYRSAQQEFRQMAAGMGASKIMLIRGGQDGGVAVFLLDAGSGEKVWVNEYSRKTNAPLDDRVELARMIVTDFVAKQKDLKAAPK